MDATKIIPVLASGAVRHQVEDLKNLDEFSIQFEALQDCLIGFVKVIERQPNRQEFERARKCIQESINSYKSQTE